MQRFIFCFICLALFSCNRHYYTSKIEGTRLEINYSVEADSTINAFIRPYRNHIDASLDSVLTYAPETYSKKDGDLNTAIGNLMADAVYAESNPIFNKRYSKNVDFVLLNHGGIRSIISMGTVTKRTAFEVMPFENAVVVVALKGSQIHKMIEYLSVAKRAHPISKQLQITFNDSYKPLSVTLKGEAISNQKTYYVATNDYLYNGGDKMDFFKSNEGVFILDYKIRSVLIDHFKKTDTLQAKIDQRFIRKQVN
jgi:2',3'-cyclic-nucleotide 2'-phosphodiesterase (5'-nucleotidase family)